MYEWHRDLNLWNFDPSHCSTVEKETEELEQQTTKDEQHKEGVERYTQL